MGTLYRAGGVESTAVPSVPLNFVVSNPHARVGPMPSAPPAVFQVTNPRPGLGAASADALAPRSASSTADPTGKLIRETSNIHGHVSPSHPLEEMRPRTTLGERGLTAIARAPSSPEPGEISDDGSDSADRASSSSRTTSSGSQVACASSSSTTTSAASLVAHHSQHFPDLGALAELIWRKAGSDGIEIRLHMEEFKAALSSDSTESGPNDVHASHLVLALLNLSRGETYVALVHLHLSLADSLANN